MYEVYQTEGIVLKSADFGEANKYLFVFTKEFGLIKVAAQGLRKVNSKLQCGLQEFSLAQLSLVQGRGVWRAINVSCESNFYFYLSKDKSKLVVLRSVMDLLNKLLSGQEKNEELYEVVRQAFFFLQNTDLDTDELKSFESILVLRILYCLGYFDKHQMIKEDVFYSTFLNLMEWNSMLLFEMKGNHKKAVFDINTSLQSSQLI